MIFYFLIAIGFLIFVHELGHFLAAKKSGLKVEEFCLGFPPRLFSKKYGETVYSVGLIIFGGFVRLRGEDDPDDPEGFLNLPKLKKIFIIIAGIFFNILAAYLMLAFSAYFGYYMPAVVNNQVQKAITVINLDQAISEVKSQLRILDKIIGVRFGKETYYFNNHKDLLSFLHQHTNKEIVLIVKRQEQLLDVKVTVPNSGVLGIGLLNYDMRYHKSNSLRASYVDGFYLLFTEGKNIIKGLGMLLYSLGQFRFDVVANNTASIFGIYNIFTFFSFLGIGTLLYFLAIISLNLAFINLLPIPALDGGRLLFTILESFNIKLSFQQEESIHKIGFIILLILMVFISLKDIYFLFLKS